MTTTSYALNKVLTAIARGHLMKDRLTEEDLAGHALTSRGSTSWARTRT